VPKAAVMFSEKAERFGLSQLHQLRGRVGRGADQSSSCHALCRPYSRGTLHRYADILLQDSLDQSFHSPTTVIEVGVNVPNASVMIIENAERFGLSQLHQLRGRVGRGADQSYCILVTTYKLTEETRKRLEIMVRTNDGFEIAEADLKLRGPGDLEGTQQSGIAFDLKIADIARDGQLLQYVRTIAEEITDADPGGVLPENAILWQQLRALRKTNVNWAAIS